MINVQRATVENVQEIKQVLSETWMDTYGLFLSQDTIKHVTTVWHDPQRLASQIRNPEIFFGIAKDETGIILGLVTARKQEADTIVIDRLYVSPPYQRKGIGNKLLEECIVAFPGTRRLLLEVEEQNEKGLSFYRKQGFKEVSRREVRVGDEVLMVIEMERRLS